MFLLKNLFFGLNALRKVNVKLFSEKLSGHFTQTYNPLVIYLLHFGLYLFPMCQVFWLTRYYVENSNLSGDCYFSIQSGAIFLATKREEIFECGQIAQGSGKMFSFAGMKYWISLRYFHIFLPSRKLKNRIVLFFLSFFFASCHLQSFPTFSKVGNLLKKFEPIFGAVYIHPVREKCRKNSSFEAVPVAQPLKIKKPRKFNRIYNWKTS